MKEKKYLLVIEKDNEGIKQLAKEHRRSLKAEINAAMAAWLKKYKKSK